MGMLLQYHDGYAPEATEDNGMPNVSADEVDEQPTATGGEQLDEPHAEQDDTEGDVYDYLSDEQVAEAYNLNVGGRATKRDSQVAALRDLDADQPTEGGSESE